MQWRALSRATLSIRPAVSGFGLSISRRAFRNNAGSSRIRFRIWEDVSRQAAYNSPASRLLNLWPAKAPAIRLQCSMLVRATGTKNFMAT
jgi:hypothetical protein